jgi:DNA modification methylase
MTGSARIVRANARNLPLADNSVDLVVTSPPYFALRSYQDGGEHYAGQIGDEPTPAEFVDSLLEVTRECVRVLKPSGSLWVNLGDKYDSGTSVGRRNGGDRFGDGRERQAWNTDKGGPERFTMGRPKSLIGIPWRYALRCIDDLGLILRAEVIWSKPNGLPESVTDRVRRSHEVWFHFTLQPRYFSAVDEIREAVAFPNQSRTMGDSANGGTHSGDRHKRQDGGANPLGKLPSSVWAVNERESLTRTVLSAVSQGKISVDEGERILWTPGFSGAESRNAQTAVGSGQASSTAMVMAATTASGRPPREHTGSPTSSKWDPSPKASDSTTSAATRPACDQTTSSPSPTQSTAPESQSGPTAHTGTSSTSGTRTSEPMASGSAEPACATGSEYEGPPSVWVIPTQPLRVPEHLGIDHFAAFPMEFPRRIIQGWSPSGVCTGCGQGRRPISDKEFVSPRGPQAGRRKWGVDMNGDAGAGTVVDPGVNLHSITGYACACPEPTAPTTPAVVLDPFGGTGTVALVAKAFGRHGISVDMSADYNRLATWRTNDPGELARAMQLEKPPAQVEGQDSLFEVDEPQPKRHVSVSLQGDRTCQTCGYRSQYARKPICDKCGTPRGEVAS